MRRAVELYPQIAARPFGMLFGFPGHHAFTHRPTFRRLKAECSREELAQRLADPAVKAAILAEDDLPPDPTTVVRQHVRARSVLARPHLCAGRSARLRTDPGPGRRQDRRRAR